MRDLYLYFDWTPPSSLVMQLPNPSDAILCLGTQFKIIDVQSPKNEDKSQSSKNKNKSKSLLATSESSITFETRTSSILGSKFLAGLTNMDIDLSGAVNSKLTHGDGEEGVDKTTSSSGKWKLQGLISHSPTSPHSTNARDLQFFSINGRPVDLPSVSRLLGDVWRLFDPTSESKGSISSSSVGRRRCACILAFTLPNNMYDVNLSPDKREVMFTEESAMLDLIRDGLMTLWSSQSEGKFAANEVESVKGSNEKFSSAVDDSGTKSISATASKAKDDEINNVTPKLRRRNTDGNPMVTPHDPNCFKRVSNNNTYRPDINDVPSRMQRVTLSQSQSQHEEKQEDSTPQIDHSDSDNGWQQSRSSLNRVKLPERSREKDRRGWEQMRINFQQIEKSQLQQDMGCVLPFNVNDNAMQNNNDKHVLTATIKPISKSDRSVLRSQRKRQKRDAASFLNSLFAYGVTTQPAAEDDEDDGSEGKNLHREVENSETINVRKIVEISREPSWRVDSGIRDARMVVGNILVAGKSPCSRDAGHESTLQTQSASKASSTEEADDSDIERNSKLPQVAIWNSFSGTQVVIALSQQARLMMQDTRKNLHSSVKKRKRASRCDGQISDADKNTTVNLCKEDFLHMLIIGQFNLGFILALCRNNNLWILDQHACDEKYNFERLCKETVIHEQKLIAPLPLELSPSEEHCVLDNMDVFERNGFCFSYDPEKQPRHRLSLTALPHSGSGADGKKAVQFGKEDVGALCAMLGADGTSSAEGYIAGFEGADGSRIAGVNAVRRYAGSDTRSDGIVGSSIVRLPKAIAMFASRACRGSIMIGMALSHKEQESILKKLDKTDIPWNCAHGRPTMSHVRSLTECLLDDNEAIAAHVASPSLSIV